MQRGDEWIVLLLAALFLIWGLRLLRHWWLAPPKSASPIEPDPEIPVTEAVALLEQAGYEVMTLKRKVPIHIRVDGGSDSGGLELESRLFIDHFARKEDKWYIVKLAKDRLPLEWTGSGIRERLLVYQLLYRDTAGVLYVDAEAGRISSIAFDIET